MHRFRVIGKSELLHITMDLVLWCFSSIVSLVGTHDSSHDPLGLVSASVPAGHSPGMDFSRNLIRPLQLIHSFGLFLWHLFKSTTAQRRYRNSTDTVSEFHAEAPLATIGHHCKSTEH